MNLLRWIGNLIPARRSLTSAELFALIGNGLPSYAGPAVNEESAMRYSAVYACVRIISESIAALPLALIRQNGRNKERATNHPLYRLLHDMPNPELTSFEWRELMFQHVLTWGNGWSEKEFDARGRVVALWPLRPDRVEGLFRNDQGALELAYRLPDGDPRRIPYWRIHHIKGPGNGLMGYSPIRWAAKQPTGLGLATEEYGARFFSNGARPGLLLKHPGKLSDPAYARLRESFAEAHQGLSNAHRVKILEEGMDIATVGIPPNEAQFLETRKFQVTEIARIYRVPPHMLADLDRATFSNIEHQSLNFVQHTLLPWLIRHEQTIWRDLLTEQERRNMFAKYIVAGMLRGDMASRSQAYTTGINAGYYTRNEVRELEDLNPIDGLDAPLVPLNMIEVGAEPPENTEPASRAAPPDREQRARDAANQRRSLTRRYVRLFEDASGRLVKREVADIRRAIKRTLAKGDVAGFLSWLARFYEDLREAAPDYFASIMESLAESISAAVADEIDGTDEGLTDDLRAFIRQYLSNYATSYTVGSEKQLRALIAEAEEDAELANELVSVRVDEWEEKKAGKEGLGQAFEAANALALSVYATAGVAFLVWMATGKSCPYCQAMDGRRMRIGQPFVDEGGAVDGGDGQPPLAVNRTVKHPPIHGGCDCVTVAG